MYSENLKKIRKELDISAAKLAKKLGVSLTSIQQYEAGTRKPNFDFIEKIGATLNLNLNWFIYGKGQMFLNNSSGDDLEQKIRAVIEKIEQEKSAN